MARGNDDAARLLLRLQADGPLGARALCAALGVSQPTLSRLVRKLGAALERMGGARSTRYACRRLVRHLGDRWPVYRMGPTGRHVLWGELRSVHGGFRFIPQGGAPAWLKRDYPDGYFSGLPFFLQDLRPQGFLGRAIAKALGPRLAVPADPRLWSDDDVLSYFLLEGDDLPGDLVVGDGAIERAVGADGLAGLAPESDRSPVYGALVAELSRGLRVGSSAGGEQPKFLARLGGEGGAVRSVLVKFTAADDTAVSLRWADLLACEHLAAELLARRGVASVGTRLLDAEGRRYLEVDRFDRIGSSGRRGVISLGALEDGLLEQPSGDWVAGARNLEAASWISSDAARTLRWLACFGDLIANSDMHRGNASFWFGDEVPFALTPCYDMLPMAYAPGPQGDLGERLFAPRPPLAGVMDVWSAAAAAAVEFWALVAASPLVSDPFRATARLNGETVSALLARFG